MPTPTVIFVPIAPDVEVRLEILTQFYNGIHTDPQILTRQATLHEIFTAAAKLNPGSAGNFSTTTTLPQ